MHNFSDNSKAEIRTSLYNLWVYKCTQDMGNACFDEDRNMKR